MGKPSISIHALTTPPDLLALHQLRPDLFPHLLATNSRHSDHSGFDILFACPQETLVADEGDFLQNLDEQWSRHTGQDRHSDWPFGGGWFLYLGYELAGQIESTLKLPQGSDIPIAFATRFPAAVMINRQNHTAVVMCEDAYAHCLNEIMTALQDMPTSTSPAEPLPAARIIEDDENAYFEQVGRIKQYIYDGDVFQVNLSRGWQVIMDRVIDHGSLYQRLARANPGPFNALVTWQDTAIISSSPERLVRVRDGVIETRPIAGTRPRSLDLRTDNALSQELMAHPKEIAEHIMLIDLERNDLGRLCRPGTVEANELMVLESYEHVHHIVSNVRGVLTGDRTPGQIIAAVFPGGTITGCPKVRCMEILAEVEGVPRQAYTGSVGYLNHDGSMDLNILIRTLMHRGDRIEFRAGGGLVMDSQAQRELLETRAKARGLLKALDGSEL